MAQSDHSDSGVPREVPVEASDQAEEVGAYVKHGDYTKTNNYGSAKTLDRTFSIIFSKEK